MSTTSLRLLGDVAVVRADGSTVVLRRGQARTVAALLVLARHRAVTRSELADALWDGDLPPHWAGAVRGVVSKVRAFLDEAGLGAALVTVGEGWRLDLSEVDVDVDVATTTVESAIRDRRSADGGAPSVEVDLDALSDALSSLADELAPGAQGHRVEQLREDLTGLRRRGLWLLAERAALCRRGDLHLAAATELSRADLYSDAAARELVAALVGVGDVTAASKEAEEFVRRLDRDLGVEPEPATSELLAGLRRSGTARRSTRSVPMVADGSVGPLVGRDAEMDDLRSTWDEVVAGAGARSVLLLGEPGAGKTRLAFEATGFVEDGVVLWGRCSADRRVSFEPVVEALDRLLPGGDPLGGLDARADLFLALADRIRSLVTGPSVWVVDDLHWANDDTAALLTHLVPAVADLPLLVVLTSRSRDGSCAELLEVAARVVPMRARHLGGLSVAAVQAMLEQTGVADAESLGERVLQRTGGNPFFLRELIRSSVGGELEPDALPDTLRSWIDQRVAALDVGAAEVLAAASVLGAASDVDVLAAVVGRDRPAVVRDVSVLLRSGLLVESGSGPEVSFAHALTRDAVHDDLSRTLRQHLHLAAAEALSATADARVAEVAGHLALAGPSADARAVPMMLVAGEDALAATAWSAASQWFDDVLERRPDPGPDRVEALIGLGAALRGLGDRARARELLEEALAVADDLGSPRHVALATLRLVGGGARGVADEAADAERAALLGAAVEGLGPDDDDLRIPLQLELALALLLTDRDEERRALADDALVRARGFGRPDLLGRALVGHRVAHHGPEHAELRLTEVDEALRIDARHRSHDVTVAALMSRHEDAVLVGDRGLARAALAEAEREVEASAHPYWRWVVRTWQGLEAIVDGRLDDAEALALEASSLQADHPEAVACLGVNLVDIRLFQGRSDEVVDLLAAAAATNPHIPAYRAVLALCLADAGHLDRAEVEYRGFAADAFAPVPDDTNRLLCLAVLADVAATIGDVDGVDRLLALLSPHSERQVVLNCFGGGGAYWGPVDTQLGRLLHLAGRHDEAEVHLAAARAAAASMGAPLALARIPTSDPAAR